MRRGFTLIELMITLAVLGVLAMLAAPSFYDFILMQRLKAASQQLVTDLQFARAEAASRNETVRVLLQSRSTFTCYSIFIGPSATACQCRDRGPDPSYPGEPNTCTGDSTEIRTVRLPLDAKIAIGAANLAAGSLRAFRFEPSNGAMATEALDLTNSPAQKISLDVVNITKPNHILRTEILLSGRPNICVPSNSVIAGNPC